MATESANSSSILIADLDYPPLYTPPRHTDRVLLPVSNELSRLVLACIAQQLGTIRGALGLNLVI
jgi:hypothetical protein